MYDIKSHMKNLQRHFVGHTMLSCCDKFFCRCFDEPIFDEPIVGQDNLDVVALLRDIS